MAASIWRAGRFDRQVLVDRPDKKGRIYVPSGAANRVYRVDPKTREIVAYLMPRKDFDVKEMNIDPISKNVVWMANVRNARLIKLEPLD